MSKRELENLKAAIQAAKAEESLNDDIKKALVVAQDMLYVWRLA